MRTLVAASLSILSTGLLPAQGHVSPAHFRHAEGPYVVMPISRVFSSGNLNATGSVNANVNVLPTRFY